MKIVRAVKCAAEREQLERAKTVAKKADIRALEIQEILPLIQKYSFRERGNFIIKIFKDFPSNRLSYHFPIEPGWSRLSKALKFDLTTANPKLLTLVEETIKEAGYVGKVFRIKPEIPIILHLFGFVKPREVNKKERRKRLKVGEKRLLELKKMADYYSRQYGVSLIVVRENNPPDQGGVCGTLDYHPKELTSLEKKEIGACLDFSHLWQTYLYYQKGRREFPGVDLNKKIFSEIKLEKVIDCLKKELKILHLNDAGPEYKNEFEGLEIGKGNFPHSFFIPLIHGKLNHDIIGTYEIRYGHMSPEVILRSDKFYQKLFKEKFKQYFE